MSVLVSSCSVSMGVGGSGESGSGVEVSCVMRVSGAQSPSDMRDFLPGLVYSGGLVPVLSGRERGGLGRLFRGDGGVDTLSRAVSGTVSVFLGEYGSGCTVPVVLDGPGSACAVCGLFVSTEQGGGPCLVPRDVYVSGAGQ